MLFIKYRETFFELYRLHTPIFRENPFRPPAVIESDPFFLCLENFFFRGGHDIPAFQTIHGNLARVTAHCRACHIYSDISTADHDGLSSQRWAVSGVDSSQKLNTGVYALGFFPLDAQLSSSLSSDRHVECVIALSPQLI